MALTETTQYDKIEIVGEFKNIQVRKADVIKKDGNEVARSFHRYTLAPGLLDGNDELVVTDLSGEPTEVAVIATAAWTDEIKAAYKAWLIANKPA